VQFILTRRYLSATALSTPVNMKLGSWLPVIGFAAAVVIVVALAVTGRLTIEPQAVAIAASWLIGLLAAAYFVYLLFFAGLSGTERNRVYVMIALFIASTVYIAGQEQTGTSLTLFAERYTDRNLFGWEMPAGILQGVSSVFIILFAPLFSALWISLERRGKDPSTPVKFAAGLALMGLGFLVMYVAATYVVADPGVKVLPTWLVLCYLVQMWGDLCLAPVGLSSMTKLAAPRFVGQIMGMWFLSVALGNNLAGLLATDYDASNLASLPALFLKIFAWGAVGAVVMLLLTPRLKRLMGGASR
jgi:proton-dependent oligopeptide transporter, POT family